MKSVPKLTPKDFVPVPLDEARVARIWAAVEARTAAPAWPRRLRLSLLVAAPVVAILVVTGGLLVLSRRTPHQPAVPRSDGFVIQTAGAGDSVHLADGSTLEVGAETRLGVVSVRETGVELRLERGTLTCDVPYRAGRRFSVRAGDAEVIVTGTRFAVDVDAADAGGRPLVAVRVERGSVLVRAANGVEIARLAQGSTWSSAPPRVSKAPSLPPEEPTPPAPPSPLASDRAPGPSPSPRALFERADGARLSGRTGEAASAFELLIRRYPRDPRSALAAYELGRIRLHSLDEPQGAVEAFTFAIDHAAGLPFVEDAETGRIEAIARLGDLATCRVLREAFLRHHATSPLKRRVAKLCGGP